MKNIFIRAGMSPFESFPAEKILVNNLIGTNIGNFLYLNGILRNITQEDTEITPTHYKWHFTDKEIDEINETQDIFIIPLADAFRDNFVAELRGLTHLVRSLKIPCVVIGVGLRSPYEPDFSKPFPFDEDVKAFVSAVLEKSSIVGVRGQITADYLSHLGFKEGTDHVAIGCPSLYTNGEALSIRPAAITKDSCVCINSSPTSPDSIHEFLHSVTQEFPNWHYMPQVRSELRILYTGAAYRVKTNPLFPTKITDEAYRSGRSQFFLNTSTWISYLSHADLSIGSRLHGNIAALLAGTPNILLPQDARTRELTEFHHLTHYPANRLDASTNIWDLLDQVDFQQPCRYQEENFRHFLSFLDRNQIPHIYKDGAAPAVIPYEERLKQTPMLPPVTTIADCSFEEIIERLNQYFPLYDKQLQPLKKDKAKLQNEVEKLSRSLAKTAKEKETLQKKVDELSRSLAQSSNPPSFLKKVKRKLGL